MAADLIVAARGTCAMMLAVTLANMREHLIGTPGGMAATPNTDQRQQ